MEIQYGSSLNTSFCAHLRNVLKEFVFINKDSVSDAQVFWDAVKGFIRKNSISFPSSQNRAQLRANKTDLLIHKARQSHYLDRSKPSFLPASKLRNNNRLADIPIYQIPY